MPFPVSPTNGQTATVNDIIYVYSSADNSWTIVPAEVPNSNTTNAVFSQANAAFVVANSAAIAANTPSHVANSAAIYANGAFSTVNTVAIFANTPSHVANSAAIYANGAFDVANSASIAANTPSHVANSAAIYANGAFAVANSASIAANTPSHVANSAAIYANGAFAKANNALANTSGTTFNGDFLIGSGGKLTLLAVGGEEGGELLLGKPPTGNLNGGITIDAYQDKIRIFEQGGSARGVYINLTEAAAGVGTNLLSGGGGGTLDQYARNTANAAFIHANSSFNFANGVAISANTPSHVANSAAIYANGAFAVANSAAVAANTPSNVANSAAIAANTPSHVANSAATYANGAFVTANAAFVRANNSLNANVGGQVTGDVTIIGNVTSNTITTTGSNGSITGANAIFSNYVFANNVDLYVYTTRSYNHSNSAYIHANAAFAFANTISGGSAIDNVARDSANSAGIYANGAFVRANSAFARANQQYIILGNTLTYIDGSTSNVWSGSFNSNLRDVWAGIQNSNNSTALFTFSSNGSNVMSVQVDGSLFIGDNFTSDALGVIPSYSGWIVASSGIKSVYNVYGGNDVQAGQNLIAGGYVQFGDGTTQNTSANSAGTYANGAFVVANSAAIAANTPSHVANSAAIYANGAFVLANGTAIAANTPSHVANSASIYANGAFVVANSAAIAANTPSHVANSAAIYANGAFTRANNSVDANNGGTITGDLTITKNLFVGNVFVTGNTFSIDAGTLVSNDTVIILGAGNYSSDIKDLGFAGHYNDGTNAHSGLIRDSVTKEWYLFKNYTPEVGSNNNVDINDASFTIDTLNANLISTFVLAKGIDLLPRTNIIFDYVNSAFTKTNSSFDVANSAAIYANGAFVTVNTVAIFANTPSDVANSAAIYANGAFVQANTPSHVANSAAIYANGAFNTVNVVAVFANTPSHVANSASIYANGAFVLANGTAIAANTPSHVANSAAIYANGAFDVANSASIAANTPSHVANSASTYANGAFVTANSAAIAANTPSDVANSAAIYANAAFEQANAAYIQANAAFDAANNASDTWVRDQANAAFERANNSLNANTGGTVTANVIINANLQVANVTTNTYIQFGDGTRQYTANAGTGGGGGGSGQSSVIKVDSFTGTGACTEFTLTQQPSGEDYTIVSLNGILQHKSAYSLSGSVITFSEAPENGIAIDVMSFVNTSGTFVNRSYTGDGSTTNFTVTSGVSANTVLVFQNGVAQRPITDYSISGSTLTFTTAPTTGEAIQIRELFGDPASASINANAAFIRANNSLNANTGGTVTANVVINANLQVANVSTNTYIQFGDGTRQYTANSGSGGGADQYARDTANAAFNTVNTVAIFANTPSHVANSASIYANGAFNTVNTVAIFANTPSDVANSAAIYANGAFDVANSASIAANTPSHVANSAAIYANGAFVTVNTVAIFANTPSHVANSAAIYANGAFSLANGTSIAANTPSDVANSASIYANGAFAVANSAAIYANGAFTRANNSVDANAGGTITGSLTVTQNLFVGNLFVTGQTFSVNSSTIVANDTLLILGSGNYSSDTKDIGFAGHYNDGTNAHSGLIRDTVTKEWYFFKNYTPEVGSNNNVDINDASFTIDTLNANVKSTYVLTKGIDLLPRTNIIFDLANSAAIAANTPSHVANSAAIYANGAFSKANDAYSLAETATLDIIDLQAVNVTQNNSIDAAFTRANNSLNANTGGTVTANVTIDANLHAANVSTSTYIQFGDGTKQYTANAGTGGGGDDQYARDTANAAFVRANNSLNANTGGTVSANLVVSGANIVVSNGSTQLFGVRSHSASGLPSTSTSTGTVVVVGGVGVSGNVYAGAIYDGRNGNQPVGYINIPPAGTKTTNYTLAKGDVGEFVEVSTGGSITIPDGVFAAGDTVMVFNNTGAGITITCSITTAYISGTDSDKATMTLATRGIASILFISGTVCVVMGNVT